MRFFGFAFNRFWRSKEAESVIVIPLPGTEVDPLYDEDGETIMTEDGLDYLQLEGA